MTDASRPRRAPRPHRTNRRWQRWAIARDLHRRIRSREFPPGSAIPSLKRLSQQYRVSVCTIQAAVTILKAKSLVVGHQGRAVYVLDDALPPTHPVDTLLVLTDGERVLLRRRRGADGADRWALPGGALGAGEAATDALVRDTDEQIGVRPDPGELRVAAAVHYADPAGPIVAGPAGLAGAHSSASAGAARVGLVFTAAHDPGRHGAPRESAKAEWFPARVLPPDTDPYAVACVRAYGDARGFLAAGAWHDRGS